MKYFQDCENPARANFLAKCLHEVVQDYPRGVIEDMIYHLVYLENYQ